MTPIALLINLAGLSQREAAIVLSASPSSVDKMARGVRSAPPGVIAELRSLISQLEHAAATALQQATQLALDHGAPEFVELGYPADDYEAQQLGWPNVGAWRGMAARVVAASPWPVKLVPRGATVGTAAAADAHEQR